MPPTGRRQVCVLPARDIPPACPRPLAAARPAPPACGASHSLRHSLTCSPLSQSYLACLLCAVPQYRPACGAWEPKDLPANLTTHAVFAFCFLNPGAGTCGSSSCPMHAGSQILSAPPLAMHPRRLHLVCGKLLMVRSRLKPCKACRRLRSLRCAARPARPRPQT